MRKLKRFIALTLTALMSFGIQGLSSYAAVGTIKNDVTVIADTADPDTLSTTTAAPARTIMTTTTASATTTAPTTVLTTTTEKRACEGCRKEIYRSEGVVTPLGMFLCIDCRKTGMGGTTTAPHGSSITTTVYTTVLTGTTTRPTTVTGTTTVLTGTTPPTTVLTTTAAPLDYCEGCGKHLESGEGIRTPLGMFLCRSCVNMGMGGTTAPPHSDSDTSTTTALTGTTPPTTVLTTTTEKRICEGCGKEIYRSEGVVTPLGIFLCTDCRATGMGGTTVPPYTGTTTTRPTAAASTTTTRPAWEMMLNPPAKTTYAVGEELDFSGADASVYGYSTGWEAIYYKISSSPITSSDFVIDSSEFNSFVPGTYRIYVYHYLSEAEYVSAYFEVTVSNPSTTPETNPSEGTAASGDANNDGMINMADAVRIMQSIANPDKYELSEQGALNADIFNNGDGVTVKDAQFLQSKLLGLA
ncbi:MAG: hypothetical protein J6A30_04625 [Ruminococcus sp.]|nr:hypothetical protein [Ruminococcus sp.]